MSGSENRQLLQEEPEQMCCNSCCQMCCCQMCCNSCWLRCQMCFQCCQKSSPDQSPQQVTTPVKDQPKATARDRPRPREGAWEESTQLPGRPPRTSSPPGLRSGQPEGPQRIPKTDQDQRAGEKGKRSTGRKSTDATIKVRIAGKTGGCEQTFLEEVSKRLSRQGVSLRVEESMETTSKDLPLLVFCPIPSRMGTDIENALEGLPGDQKAILVVMHYLPKDNTETFLDATWQGTDPALVQTVHTRYTLQEGFYHCNMNKRAVADVAAAIKALAKGH